MSVTQDRVWSLRSFPLLRSTPLLRSRPDRLSGMCPEYSNCRRSFPDRLPPWSSLMASSFIKAPYRRLSVLYENRRHTPPCPCRRWNACLAFFGFEQGPCHKLHLGATHARRNNVAQYKSLNGSSAGPGAPPGRTGAKAYCTVPLEGCNGLPKKRKEGCGKGACRVGGTPAGREVSSSRGRGR